MREKRLYDISYKINNVYGNSVRFEIYDKEDNYHLYHMIVNIYSDEDGDIDIKYIDIDSNDEEIEIKMTLLDELIEKARQEVIL